MQNVIKTTFHEMLFENSHDRHDNRKHVDEYSTSSKFEHVGQNKSIIKATNVSCLTQT